MTRHSLRQQVTVPAQLNVYDTLTKSIRPLTLRDGKDRLDWYSCGPTVYDASHLGHARNYVTTDILRRLLEGYFGLQVRYVQNVTDVDDKIIVKARQQLLFDRYRGSREEVRELFAKYIDRHFGESGATPETWLSNPLAARDPLQHPKDYMHIEALSAAAQSLTSEDFDIASARDIIVSGIDTPDQQLTNDEIVHATKALTTFWEADFNADMASLGVLPPDQITRVTDYMPQIVDFVDRLVVSGLAYETGGSVYFDVARFIAAGHEYAKLKPSSMATSADALLDEAEGSLSAAIAQAKRSKRDFALWKASKVGEPSWPSPWGQGRPGWHIECSVMASDVFGPQMDIHSGGEDLTFPHHDNELAQSEAYHGCHDWVRYFLHTGHLHIRGLKMSKSLKNFITIKQVLEEISPRLLRFIFLSGRWRGRVDYSDDLLKSARNFEAKVQELFVQVRELEGDTRNDALASRLQQTRDDVDAALADDFDTPLAMTLLRDLVTESNKHMSHDHVAPSATLRDVAHFVTDLLGVFGVEVNDAGEYGWPVDVDAALMNEVRQIAECRQEIRERVAAGRDIAGIMAGLDRLSLDNESLRTFRASLARGDRPILVELDRFRDDVLPELGIALDDRKDGFILKASSPEILLAKKAEKEQQARDKAAKKAAQKEREAAALEKGRIRAEEMFRGDTRYTSFDQRGIPTHLEGSEISKSMAKKLLKEYEQQKKSNKRFDDFHRD
ncbi:cysteinyl-tRNA synthetase [Savitreella phatthalungensis]